MKMKWLKVTIILIITGFVLLSGCTVPPETEEQPTKTLPPDDNMNVFVRGSDDAVWYQSYDGTSWSGWACQGGIVRDDPDAASLNSETYIFARGADDALWYRTISTGWQSLGGIINISPDVASYEGEINVFARGSDNALWYQTTSDGTIWSGWACLGGVLNSGPGAS